MVVLRVALLHMRLEKTNAVEIKNERVRNEKRTQSK
jgi:hypothetical protein